MTSAKATATAAETDGAGLRDLGDSNRPNGSKRARDFIKEEAEYGEAAAPDEPAAKRLKTHHHCAEARSAHDGDGKFPCLCGFENPFLVIITPTLVVNKDETGDDDDNKGKEEKKEGKKVIALQVHVICLR
jgi:hypothetical protein